MGNPWFRSWVGTAADAKLAEVALITETPRASVVGIWQAILESASEAGARGAFTTTSRRIAALYAEPPSRMEAVFSAMTELGLIRDGLVVAWEKRQPSSESPSDAAERQRRRRGRERRDGGDREPQAIGAGAEPELYLGAPVTDCHGLSRRVTAPESELESDPPPPPAGEGAKSGEEGFAELTGAKIIPLRAADPLEAEARLLAAGLALAASDFSGVARAIGDGQVERGDLAAAIADARNAGDTAPRSFAALLGWAHAAKGRRLRVESRAAKGAVRAAARAPPATAGPPIEDFDVPAPAADAAAAAALARAYPRLEPQPTPFAAAPRAPPGFSARDAPNAADRAAMQRRALALDAALQLPGPERARAMMAALFVGAVAARPGDIDVYAAELAKFPLFAVARACRASRGSGSKFRPAPAELIAAATGAAAPFFAERTRLGHVLAAEVRAAPLSQEDRARFVADTRARIAGQGT